MALASWDEIGSSTYVSTGKMECDHACMLDNTHAVTAQDTHAVTAQDTHAVTAQDTVCMESIVNSDVFKDELGTMNAIRAELSVKDNVKPQFNRPRPVPFALKTIVDELHRLGIVKKVSHSEWAAPIVVVPKKDGKLRLCGDYKVTVNRAFEVDQYPLPRPDDLFATLANDKTFSKLDLKQAYQQMLLVSGSEKYLTINIHLGLYQYTRLPFGVASAPAIFQRAMPWTSYCKGYQVSSAIYRWHFQMVRDLGVCVGVEGVRRGP